MSGFGCCLFIFTLITLGRISSIKWVIDDRCRQYLISTMSTTVAVPFQSLTESFILSTVSPCDEDDESSAIFMLSPPSSPCDEEVVLILNHGVPNDSRQFGAPIWIDGDDVDEEDEENSKYAYFLNK